MIELFTISFIILISIWTLYIVKRIRYRSKKRHQNRGESSNKTGCKMCALFGNDCDGASGLCGCAVVSIKEKKRSA